MAKATSKKKKKTKTATAKKKAVSVVGSVMKPQFKRGQKVKWESVGPGGSSRKREGVIRGFVGPGEDLPFPESADLNKFKALGKNSIHSRYLVEIPRVHARTDKKLPSQWMAPKAVTLEKTAKAIG